ncbi:MAG TPA: hypothetical protein EYQ74_14635 [Planctomycetes bacterium]|nr:hypothetical protein [Planctomycetota bacterium]HIK61068.1 hypothetical protein [Planctomycetota bacterium]
MTIPATIDGQIVSISGTNSGVPGNTGITAASLSRLLDANAAMGGSATDATFPGAGRPLFNNLLAAATDQTALDAIMAHAQAVSAECAGILGLADPLIGTYPVMSGGTFKCAGHLYQDSAGVIYHIPDSEIVIELAENVRAGPMAVDTAGNILAGKTSSGFLTMGFGDMVCVMNQDPRFNSNIIGAANAPLTADEFIAMANVTPAGTLTVIGHTVGDKFMFIQDVETEFVKPGNDIYVSLDRLRVRPIKNELRLRGVVDKPAQIAAEFVEFKNTLGQTLYMDIVDLDVDPIDPTLPASYSYRFKNNPGMQVSQVRWVELFSVNSSGTEIPNSRWIFDRNDF